MSRAHRIAVVALVILTPNCFSQSTANGAAGGAAVALVTYVNCPLRSCFVRRGSASQPVRSMMTLQVGDVVETRAGLVEIATADRRTIRVAGTAGHVQIEPPARPDSVLMRLWSVLEKQFSSQDFAESSASARSVPLAGAMSLSLCLTSTSTKTAKLAAGTREVTVVAAGGSGSYSLALPGVDGEHLSERSPDNPPDSPFRLISLQTTLEPGPAVLVLTDDKTGASRQAMISVVARSSVPRPPRSLLFGAPGDPGVIALRLSWLSQQDDGVWALEAYSEAMEENQALTAVALAAGCTLSE